MYVCGFYNCDPRRRCCIYFASFLILRERHWQGFWTTTSHNALVIPFLPDMRQLTTLYNQPLTLKGTDQETTVP